MVHSYTVNSYSLSTAIGGTGGLGGNGDAVQVSSHGRITTQADYAYGILGQSIGGGGGAGGSSKTALADIGILTSFDPSAPLPSFAFDLSIGGTGGKAV